VGIIGYLLGPLAGGMVAESAGYAFVGLVPAAAAIAVVALLIERPRSLGRVR
jgi:predicted MFS family arabinose efflux permease